MSGVSRYFFSVAIGCGQSLGLSRHSPFASCCSSGANPTINISSNVRVASLTSSETIVINNNLVNGSVQVSGEMVLNQGELRWRNGDLRVGTLLVDSAATLNIQTGDDDGFSGVLTNAGTVNQTSLVEISFSRTAFRNDVGGSWNLENEFRAATGSSIVFTNAGTFRRSGDTPTQFSSGDRFDHVAGSRIEVSSGVMLLPLSGVFATPSTGAFFDVAAGATLDLNTGTSYWIGNYSGTGGGRIKLSRGTINLEDPAGGTGVIFDFPEGLFHWTGGTILTDALTGDKFVNAGHMTWSGDGERALRGAAFHNRGTVVQTDGTNLRQRNVDQFR